MKSRIFNQDTAHCFLFLTAPEISLKLKTQLQCQTDRLNLTRRHHAFSARHVIRLRYRATKSRSTRGMC